MHMQARVRSSLPGLPLGHSSDSSSFRAIASTFLQQAFYLLDTERSKDFLSKLSCVESISRRWSKEEGNFTHHNPRKHTCEETKRCNDGTGSLCKQD